MVLEPAELGRRRGCQVSNGSTCSTSTRLEGYAAVGLPMWDLALQNESEARQRKFESCANTSS